MSMIEFEEQRIWNRVFDPTTNTIKITAGGLRPDYDTEYSIQEILNRCFNPTTKELQMS